MLTERRRWAAARPLDAPAQHELAEELLLRQPAAAAEAMAAIAAADYLTAGKDPAVLDCKAAIHDALGEPGPAARCRLAAQKLRAAALVGKPVR